MCIMVSGTLDSIAVSCVCIATTMIDCLMRTECVICIELQPSLHLNILAIAQTGSISYSVQHTLVRVNPGISHHLFLIIMRLAQYTLLPVHRLLTLTNRHLSSLWFVTHVYRPAACGLSLMFIDCKKK